MEIIIRKSFTKAYKSCPKNVQGVIRSVIEKLEVADSLEKANLDYTKMEGQKKGERYYRIRIGDWRIGCEYINPTIILITVLSRGNIYKSFPPA